MGNVSFITYYYGGGGVVGGEVVQLLFSILLGGGRTLLGGGTSSVFPIPFYIKPDNMVTMDNLIFRINYPH